MDINSVTIVGRLTRDIEVKDIPGGQLGKFSVAVGRRYKKGEQWVDETDYIDCVMFRALQIAQYMVKGKQVAVQGSLSQSRWQTQDGQNRSKIEVRANTVQLLGGERNPGGQPGRKNPTPGNEGINDDIPF